MQKILMVCVALMSTLLVVAQDAKTGATTLVTNTEKNNKQEVKANDVDLTYELVLINKTNSHYRVTLDGRTLGKLVPKKKQVFKVQSGGEGKLMAIQLDGYDIIPSKIQWNIPSQVPGTSVTFTIKKQ